METDPDPDAVAEPDTVAEAEADDEPEAEIADTARDVGPCVEPETEAETEAETEPDWSTLVVAAELEAVVEPDKAAADAATKLEAEAGTEPDEPIVDTAAVFEIEAEDPDNAVADENPCAELADKVEIEIPALGIDEPAAETDEPPIEDAALLCETASCDALALALAMTLALAIALALALVVVLLRALETALLGRTEALDTPETIVLPLLTPDDAALDAPFEDAVLTARLDAALDTILAALAPLLAQLPPVQATAVKSLTNIAESIFHQFRFVLNLDMHVPYLASPASQTTNCKRWVVAVTLLAETVRRGVEPL